MADAPGLPSFGHLVTVRLPPALVDQITAWAAENGMTRSEAIKRFIENGLPRRITVTVTKE